MKTCPSWKPPARSRAGWPLAALLGCSALALRAQNVEFSQSSVPAGVVDQITFPMIGTPVSTVTAPDSVSGYRWTHWEFNGLPQYGPGGTGCAVNPVRFVIGHPVNAVIHYLPEGQDSDIDGLLDWWEIRSFGNLAQDPDGVNGNADGDDFDNAAEYRRGTCPVTADSYDSGGISRRRGMSFYVDTRPPSPAPEFAQGGISRRRSALLLAAAPGQRRLTEVSDPAGVIARTRVFNHGATALLTTPPDPFSGYRFTGWLDENSSRLDLLTDGSPRAHPVPVLMDRDITAVARYTPETADTDNEVGDGVMDWLELYYFNDLDEEPDDNPDNDDFSIAVEQFRGYSPVAHDELAPGGVSRRRSAVFTADTSGRLVWRTVSVPATILDDTQWLPAGTVVNVPDRSGHVFSGYRFSWWARNGDRVEDASGAALGAFSFLLDQNTGTTAHYYPETDDSDGDGIPDWHEWSYYGDPNGQDEDSDTDDDDWTYRDEYFRGQSPQVADTLVAGGISRRRSALTAVNAIFLPNPPAIGVNVAREITRTSAVLSAVVNPIGSPTVLRFHYGTTPAYGMVTGEVAVGSGLNAVKVEIPIFGLMPATVYHFRASATNGEGTTVGSDFVFQTQLDDFGVWKHIHRVTGGPGDDDDSDRISNGIEFVIGGDPTGPGSASRDLLPTATLDDTDLIFTYRRTDASAAYDPYVEYGSSLTGWTVAEDGEPEPPAAPVRITEINDGFGPGIDQVVVRIPRVLDDGIGFYARLRVDIP